MCFIDDRSKDDINSVAEQDEFGPCLVIICSCARKTVTEKSDVRTSLCQAYNFYFGEAGGRGKTLEYICPWSFCHYMNI